MVPFLGFHFVWGRKYFLKDVCDDHTRKIRCTLHLNSASGIKMTTVSSEKNPWFCDRNASLVALAGTNMLFFWICSAQSTSGGGFWGSFHLWSFRTPRIWSIVRMVGFPEAMAVWAIRYGWSNSQYVFWHLWFFSALIQSLDLGFLDLAHSLDLEH